MDQTAYKTVLFDLDGTLTDPKPGITRSVQYALAKFGINEDNLDNLVGFIGPPLMKSFMEFYGFDEKEARQAVEYYREYFADKGIFENRIYPGIPELLSVLKERGKVLAVATSKPTVFSEKILDHFGIRKYFELVVGSELDGSRAEKGEVIAHALGLLGAGRRETVMIGDRLYDVLGARENNIDCIGVTWGYGSLQELAQAAPNHLASSIPELAALLNVEHCTKGV